ncbi:transglutaminase family protein [Alteraurantiacibacter aestuarii]|uniref:Transglutaminase family protein n=1 Tax=Alteraurantiacibacter aestuarii TaxID=650004 RepID=A0A844ZNW1_9SPHN|nr:transglutaminase family protein [Alteraurantiacibacter aestuarii]MXO88700.1 transglutaminase family protein [Alteraurantiacibacter aestuarii]
MIFRVLHVTDIRYAALVRLARFNVRLEPTAWAGQRLFDYRLTVTPHANSVVSAHGPYVVNSSRLLLSEPISSLRIESAFSIEVAPRVLDLTVPCPSVAEIRRAGWRSRDLSESGPALYLFNSPIVKIDAEIGDWAHSFLNPADSVLQAGKLLMHAIYSQFSYDSDATKTETPPKEAFRQRRGVCQDFAHIMIAALRSHGIPAGYVSGYLRTIPPPGRERLVGCDAMHAWVNIWCGEELGWVGFDPTNDLVVGGDHIIVAMGRDYADVAPVDGVFHGNAGQTLQVSVDVLPIESSVTSID